MRGVTGAQRCTNTTAVGWVNAHTQTHADTHTRTQLDARRWQGQWRARVCVCVCVCLDVDRLGTWRHVASTVRLTARCRSCSSDSRRQWRHHQQWWLMLCLRRRQPARCCCSRRWLAVLVLVLHVLWKWAGVTERLEAVFTAERLLAAVQTAVFS